MAATAYASLVSLLNTLDLIHNHPRLSTSLDNFQNQSLREMVDFFVDFVEKYSDAESREAEDLVRRIAAVAHEAEDLIEVHAADRIRAGSTTKNPTLLLGLQRIIDEMNWIHNSIFHASFKEKVGKLEEGTGFITQSSMPPPPSSSAPPATSKTTTMLGFDSYVEQLLHQLIGHHSGRRILPIVGMGGIGKTTLATNLYQNSLILHHFEIRAWITVSQQFSARDILLQALSCLNKCTDKMDRRTGKQLGEELYKILYLRRYLIVLDDVWSVEAWDEVKFYFPENNNGSRVVVRTRESELVDYFGSSAVVVDFLDEKNSWELFCEKTFTQQGCPHPDLEEVGKRIVKKCRELPLAIIVVGGFLGKSSRTPEYWEKIAKDRSLILNSEEGNKPSSILNLSYKHLPIWLKPCFLHLRVFREDDHICVAHLINLWVAEGFIKSKTDQSLEETAESYMKDLVDRNLLLVPHLGGNKKLGYCGVHDLIRDMCITIGEKEGFCRAQREMDGTAEFKVERTAKFYPHRFETPSLMRPLIFHHGQRAAPFKSRLMRVLAHDDGWRLDYTFRQVNLRFLWHKFPKTELNGKNAYSFPSSISLLWSLQYLIVHGDIKVDAPCEIWKMPHLRCIEFQSIYLPDPRPGDDGFVLHNLHTIRTVENLSFSEGLCKKIPNIKKLQITYCFLEEGETSRYYHLHNVGCFNKLESLDIFCSGWKYGCDSLHNLKLPSSLKELNLWGCNLELSDMAMIASLPRLQVLQLRSGAIVGHKWDCVEGEFRCLKHLQISCFDLIKWSAETSSFPVLETLSLSLLSHLEEIPSPIGDIPTLEEINVLDCNESVNVSAIEILKEQQSFGNESIQLGLKFWHETDAETWRGKIQQLGITCQNLHIKGAWWNKKNIIL